MSSILFAVALQHREDVVNRRTSGTMKAGDSWVIQANFPGTRNPKRELLYLP